MEHTENPVAAFLTRAGLSKYALAKRTGLSWKAIHRVATGRHRTGYRIAKIISAGTDGEVSVEEIMAIGSAGNVVEDTMDASLCHASDGVNCGVRA